MLEEERRKKKLAVKIAYRLVPLASDLRQSSSRFFIETRQLRVAMSDLKNILSKYWTRGEQDLIGSVIVSNLS